MATISVAHPNGISLRLFEMIEGPLGIKESRQKGETIDLNAGSHEVDDDFAKAWLEQNKDTDLVKRGVIRVLHSEPPKGDGNASAPKPSNE